MIQIISCAEGQVGTLQAMYQVSRVINCKSFKNPYHDKKLRRYNGLHPLVQNEMIGFKPFYDKLKKEMNEIQDGEIVVCYCFAGHHRSVAMADMLKENICNKYDVNVTHLNLPAAFLQSKLNPKFGGSDYQYHKGWKK